MEIIEKERETMFIGNKEEIQKHFESRVIQFCDLIKYDESDGIFEERITLIKQFRNFAKRIETWDKYSKHKIEKSDILKVVVCNGHISLINVSQLESCETEYMMYLAIDIKDSLLKNKPLYLDNYLTALIQIYDEFKKYDDLSCGLLEMVDSFIYDKKDYIIGVLKKECVSDFE